MISRVAAVVVLLAAGLVGSAAPAAACSCVALPVEEAIATHDVAFVGEVDQAVGGVRSVTFVVEDVLRGEPGGVGAHVDVVTPATADECGATVRDGNRLLVVASYGTTAREDPARLHGSSCTMTPLDDVVIGLEGSAVGDGFPILGWLSLVAVAGLAAMAVGLWLRLLSQLGRR